jgi:hypothetical protein
MHAVTIKVEVLDRDKAEQDLQEHVVPMAKQAPGFVAGYWLAPAEGMGWSLMFFESEDAARAAVAEIRARPGRPDAPAKITDIGDMRVIAHA